MRNLSLLTSTAAFAIMVPATAFAQDSSGDSAPADSGSASSADVIIVTARRRAEDINKVPISVAAFSSIQLEKKGINSTLDLAKITPGFNITLGAVRSNPYVVLRGQSKSVSGAGSPGVLTYFNEVPLGTQGSLIQTYDMDNIQVLKGPQGTLFGRNSIGGAVLAYSKAPTHEFGGYVHGQIAEYNSTQIDGALNVPIVQDKLSLRIAAQYTNDGGSVQGLNYDLWTINNNGGGNFTATPGRANPTGRNADAQRSKSVRASLLLEPFDGFRSVTVADYSNYRGSAAAINTGYFPSGYRGTSPALYYFPSSVLRNVFAGSGSPPPIVDSLVNIFETLTRCGTSSGCDINLAQQELAGNTNRRISYNTMDPWKSVAILKGITNTTSFGISDNHTLKNIISYRTVEVFNSASLTGQPIPIVNTGSTTRLGTFTEELQLSGAFLDNKLQYTLGGFYLNEKPNGPGGSQITEVNAFFGLSHSISGAYIHNKSKALYGQLEYSLDDVVEGLTVSGGLRQTWDSQELCAVSQTLSPFGPAMVGLTLEGTKTAIAGEDDCRSGAQAGFVNLPKVKFKKLTYSMALNWQMTPDAMVYLTHRRGYRAGGNNAPVFDPFLASAQAFTPETLTDFEIGTKLRWNVGSVRGTFELAAFTGKDKGNQLPVATSNLAAGVCIPDAVGTAGRAANCTTNATQRAYTAGTPGVLVRHVVTSTVTNGGELTIRGIEAAGTITPADWLTLGGSFAYTDVKVDDISIDATLLELVRAANGFPPTTIRIDGQPKWTANANVLLRYPGIVLGGQLSATMDFRYTGSSTNNDIVVPVYRQLDGRVMLDDVGGTGVNAALFVTNLLDRRNYIGGAASAPVNLGTISYIPGPPRTVGLALTYRFGGE